MEASDDEYGPIVATWGSQKATNVDQDVKAKIDDWHSLVDPNAKIKPSGLGSGNLHRQGRNYKPIDEKYIIESRLKINTKAKPKRKPKSTSPDNGADNNQRKSDGRDKPKPSRNANRSDTASSTSPAPSPQIQTKANARTPNTRRNAPTSSPSETKPSYARQRQNTKTPSWHDTPYNHNSWEKPAPGTMSDSAEWHEWAAKTAPAGLGNGNTQQTPLPPPTMQSPGRDLAQPTQTTSCAALKPFLSSTSSSLTSNPGHAQGDAKPSANGWKNSTLTTTPFWEKNPQTLAVQQTPTVDRLSSPAKPPAKEGVAVHDSNPSQTTAAAATTTTATTPQPQPPQPPSLSPPAATATAPTTTTTTTTAPPTRFSNPRRPKYSKPGPTPVNYRPGARMEPPKEVAAPPPPENPVLVTLNLEIQAGKKIPVHIRLQDDPLRITQNICQNHFIKSQPIIEALYQLVTSQKSAALKKASRLHT